MLWESLFLLRPENPVSPTQNQMTVAPVSLKKPRPPTTLMVDPNGSNRVAIGQLQVEGKITARLMTWTWLEITELKQYIYIYEYTYIYIYVY